MGVILGTDGKKIEKTRSTLAMVCTSDDGEEWRALPAEEVPEWVKSKDVMGHMMEGGIVAMDDGGPYYSAESIESLSQGVLH